MPRKTRKDLTDPNEEQDRADREERYKRLARDLHTAWRASEGARLSGASPEVKTYQSAL